MSDESVRRNERLCLLNIIRRRRKMIQSRIITRRNSIACVERCVIQSLSRIEATRGHLKKRKETACNSSDCICSVQLFNTTCWAVRKFFAEQVQLLCWASRQVFSSFLLLSFDVHIYLVEVCLNSFSGTCCFVWQRWRTTSPISSIKRHAHIGDKYVPLHMNMWAKFILLSLPLERFSLRCEDVHSVSFNVLRRSASVTSTSCRLFDDAGWNRKSVMFG